MEELDSHKKFEQTPVLQSIMGHDRIRIELKLNQVDDRYFELLHVNDDYQLREFVLSEGYEFHAGCAYYEFKNEIEYVSEDKQLVFMKVSSSQVVLAICYTSIQHQVNYRMINFSCLLWIPSYSKRMAFLVKTLSALGQVAMYSSSRVYQDQVSDTSKLVVGFSIARYVLHIKLLLQ